MAIRKPLYFGDLTQNNPPFVEYGAAEVEDIKEVVSFTHSRNPAILLEVGGSNGVPLPNQAFTDTYHIAGTHTSNPTAYETEANTPNVELVTEYYNNIRIVNNNPGLPMTDTNNFEYPLYLTAGSGPGAADRELRAMTRQDFIDTFVTPALDMISNYAYNDYRSGGRYFLSTQNSGLNDALLISSTPVAKDSVANVAAYQAANIPETQKQVLETNYYLWRTYPSFDDFGLMYLRMPLYFDAGTEEVRQHDLDSFSNLLRPFLRYYLGGGDSNYTIDYNINGAGDAAGAQFTNSLTIPTGSGYAQKFDGANYLTQEFPTGSASVDSSYNKQLNFTSGAAETVNLSGSTTTPNSMDGVGPVPQTGNPSAWQVRNGFRLLASGKLEKVKYTEESNPQLFSTTEWCTTTPTTTYYARFTDDTSATMSGTTRVPATGENYNQTTDYWRVTQDYFGTYATLEIKFGGVLIYQNQYQPPSSAQNVTSISVGGKTYYRGSTQTGYSYTQNWGIYYIENLSGATRVTANGGDQLGTWHPLDADRDFYYESTSAPDATTRFMQTKVEVASDAAGSNILDTGYYRTVWSGASASINSLVDMDVDSSMSGQGTAAYAEFFVYANGTMQGNAYGTGGGGGAATISGSPQTWLASGTASDFECRWNFTLTATGAGAMSVGNGTSGSWLNMGTTRQWTIQDSGGVVGLTTCTGTFEIREVGTTTVLASCDITLTTDQQP